MRCKGQRFCARKPRSLNETAAYGKLQSVVCEEVASDKVLCANVCLSVVGKLQV